MKVFMFWTNQYFYDSKVICLVICYLNNIWSHRSILCPRGILGLGHYIINYTITVTMPSEYLWCSPWVCMTTVCQFLDMHVPNWFMGLITFICSKKASSHKMFCGKLFRLTCYLFCTRFRNMRLAFIETKMSRSVCRHDSWTSLADASMVFM